MAEDEVFWGIENFCFATTFLTNHLQSPLKKCKFWVKSPLKKCQILDNHIIIITNKNNCLICKQNIEIMYAENNIADLIITKIKCDDENASLKIT